MSGAGGGLGSALATKLSETHEVVGFGRRPYSGNFVYYKDVDLGNLASMPEPLLQCIRDCDVLVNNAAVGFDGLLATQSLKSLDDLLDVNLKAPLVLSRELVRGVLVNPRTASIVNISSVTSIRGFKGLGAYSATKSGLDGMTRSLARELGPIGIRVNSVLPGFFQSDLSASLDEGKRQQIIRRTPLRRLASVEDIVAVIEFMISDAGSFITGQSIVVDGGMSA